MRTLLVVINVLPVVMLTPVLWVIGKLGWPQAIAVAVSKQIMRSRLLRRQAFKGYQPDGHDVFVATFAKSGTNWMMQIVHQIANLGQGEFGHVHDIIPWPDYGVPMKARIEDDSIWQSAPAKLRAIKTHFEADWVPYSAEAKYVIVIRDPKDAVVSGFHFIRGILPPIAHVSLDVWVDMFTSGQYFFDSWAVHTASYWAWRDRDNVLIVTFDELKRDLEGSVRRVADLMGVTLAAEQLALVVEKSHFKYMKAHESQFRPLNLLPFMPVRSKMLRSGKSGESKEALSETQLAAIDNFALAELEQLGSDFPYQTFFMPEEVA